MSEIKTYIVTMRKRFPSWDEKDGIASEQTGRNKREAIQSARREMSNAGHLHSQCGLVWFSAKEIDNQCSSGT